MRLKGSAAVLEARRQRAMQLLRAKPRSTTDYADLTDFRGDLSHGILKSIVEVGSWAPEESRGDVRYLRSWPFTRFMRTTRFTPR